MWVALSFAFAAPAPLDAVVFVAQGTHVCAGTRLDGDVVLTAYHCVVSGGPVRVRGRDGRQVVGRVRAVDRARDLALVDVPGLGGPTLPWSPDPPTPGDAVRAIGHPLGAAPPAGFFEGTLRWSLSGGEVAAIGTRAIQVTAAVNPGNSGGPILDEDDRVVGVVSRRLGGEGLGFAGRVDGLDALRARPARRMSPLGGTVGVEALVQANGDLGTPFSVGARLEVALRDRLIASGAAALPIAARWEAVQFGAAIHQPLEGRLALAQRIGTGPWSARFEAWLGVGLIESIEADGLRTARDQRAAPLVGGRVTARRIGLDYGVALGEVGFSRLQVSVRWPGTLFVL